VTPEFDHAPVLLTETVTALAPASGGRYIDATVGGAGHAEKVLELSYPAGLLLGIDADPVALTASSHRLARFGDRVTLAEGYFDTLAEIATAADFTGVQGILFDLGLSSPQIDRADRGFSFQQDAPLDMRFGPSAGVTAEELLATLQAGELEWIFREYGEERFARGIAGRIVLRRRLRPIRTTRDLADIVAHAKPSGRREPIHPATRVFQALRIAVNDELGRLKRALPQAVDLLAPGGHLAVISFHSLEDRIVKQFVRREAQDCICPPEVPVCSCGHKARLLPITRRPISASAAEVERNPRARSAKLRVAERLAA
jgi:16S rRNA (cytosine1402-N4)-methyltransferase